mgnify:CR=1 FL=1
MKLGLGQSLVSTRLLPVEGSSFANQYSMEFDGVNDYIDLGDSDDFSFGNGTTDSPFSISAWIKIGQTTSQGIVTKYGSVNSTQEYLFYTTTGKLRLLLLDANNGENNFTTGITNLAIDTWYHVACTYDGRGGINARLGITLYINGDEETVTTSGGAYTAMSNTSQPVQIGKHLTSELLGNIDEVAIFNSELSASDITSIYNSGTPNDLTSLNPVAWYRMGDSGAFLDPQWLLPSNENKDNYSNYSLDFDGVNDRMNVLYPQIIGRTQTISISVWMKLGTSGATGKQLIVGNYASSNLGVGFHEIAGDVMIFQVGDGTNDSYFNSRVASFSTHAPTDTWNHWLGTWDGTDSKIYINGVLRNTWTPSSPLTIQWSTTASQFLIGAYSQHHPNGRIDELGLFDSGVSIGDVWDGSGKPIDITGVTGLTNNWRIGEDATFDGTNWTIPDIKGLATGTTSNMDISDRVGDAPGSANNGLSINMDRFDQVEDVPT